MIDMSYFVAGITSDSTFITYEYFQTLHITTTTLPINSYMRMYTCNNQAVTQLPSLNENTVEM